MNIVCQWVCSTYFAGALSLWYEYLAGGKRKALGGTRQATLPRSRSPQKCYLLKWIQFLKKVYNPALEKTAAVGVAKCCQSDQPPPSHYIPHLTPHVLVMSARVYSLHSGDLSMSSPW